MNKSANGLLIGVFVGVAVLVIGYFLIGSGPGTQGLLNHPNPILMFSNGDSACPSSISFDNGGISPFKITIRNSGAEGNIYVNVSGANLKVKNGQFDTFSDDSVRMWDVPTNTQNDFSFYLNNTDENGYNITVNTVYGCVSALCMNTYALNCKYQRTGTSNQYSLVAS